MMTSMRTIMFKVSGVVSAGLLAACTTAPMSSPTAFEGTWVPNVAESIVPPEQRIPADMRSVIRDDGHLLQTTQTFTGGLGRKAEYVWNSICDGTASDVQGVDPPGFVTMSCERNPDGSMVDKLTDTAGYSQVETCRVTPDGRKQICKGVAHFPDGTERSFVNVFDRE
jgi:hypothetical protein